MGQLEDYLKLRAFLEEKTKILWNHEVAKQKEKGKELKNSYQSGFSISNICQFESPSGAQFYMAWTNTFRDMVYDGTYYASFLRYPERFGTGNAEDVLSALFSSLNKDGLNIFNWNIERYTEYLREENCCYVVRKEGESFSENFLRIDLFRLILPTKGSPEKKEFVGGLFHVFDHFSINGKNLGTGKDINNVQSIMDIVFLCIEAFSNFITISKDKAYGIIEMDSSHNLKLAFYREPKLGAFYINTAHIVRERKNQI